MMNLNERTTLNKTSRTASPRGMHPRKQKRECNICKGRYLALTKFDRFCAGCKERSELYHFSEWFTAD